MNVDDPKIEKTSTLNFTFRNSMDFFSLIKKKLIVLVVERLQKHDGWLLPATCWQRLCVRTCATCVNEETQRNLGSEKIKSHKSYFP